MRPISALTTAAGQIAATRDPGVTLDNPVTNDEVGELTTTFNEMLHELSLARSEREQSLHANANSSPTPPMSCVPR